jgi:hypothetical protein
VQGKADPGLSAVRWLYDSMKIDQEWSVIESRGFSWWGHRFCQRVWSEDGVDDHGVTIYRLCAETDLLHGLPEDDTTLLRKMVAFNRLASINALVKDGSEIKIYSHAYVHEKSPSWVPGVFSLATILQVIAAERQADVLSRLLGGESHLTAHPQTGPRPSPDELLSVQARVVTHGQRSSPWVSSREWESVADLLTKAGYVANADASGITAECEFEDARTSLLEANATDEHPALGHGLAIRLRLPVSYNAANASDVASALNQIERDYLCPAHLLGSWCTDSASNPATEGLAFASFYPAVLHNEGLLTNLVLNMASRARWIPDQFSDQKPEPGGSAE